MCLGALGGHFGRLEGACLAYRSSREAPESSCGPHMCPQEVLGEACARLDGPKGPWRPNLAMQRGVLDAKTHIPEVF